VILYVLLLCERPRAATNWHGRASGARFDVRRSAAGLYSVTGRSLIGIRQTSTHFHKTI